ncbi:MAG: glycosyltransferase [Armatimonadota bacterium]
MPARQRESGLTILQVLSWLNYGGVESYAIHLSRALRDRGHRVLIASSGGQLVPELEAAGIEHFNVDFTGPRTLRGARALRRLLESEHVDLVNAHNWRAGMGQPGQQAQSRARIRPAGIPRGS